MANTVLTPNIRSMISPSSMSAASTPSHSVFADVPEHHMRVISCFSPCGFHHRLIGLTQHSHSTFLIHFSCSTFKANFRLMISITLWTTRLTTLEYSAYRYRILWPVLISSLTLSRTGTTNCLLRSAYFDTSRCLKGPGVATIPLVSMQHNQVTALSNVPLARTRNVIFLKGGKMRLNMSSELSWDGCYPPSNFVLDGSTV
jgi:hypothetical protein